MLGLVVALFLFSYVESTCPPSSGIYMRYDGDCYPSGSYFDQSTLMTSGTGYLECALSGASSFQWRFLGSSRATPSTASFSVSCTSVVSTIPWSCTRSGGAYFRLYKNAAGTHTYDDRTTGDYECCTPSCSPGNDFIRVRIFCKYILYIICSSEYINLQTK